MKLVSLKHHHTHQWSLRLREVIPFKLVLHIGKYTGGYVKPLPMTCVCEWRYYTTPEGEQQSKLPLTTSGQPSFLVRRKSAMLRGRALFSPAVLSYPQLCSIIPNCALFSLIGKIEHCGFSSSTVWHLE